MPTIDPGEIVTWTYVVQNTGDVVFNRDEVVVKDSMPGVTPVWVQSSDDGDQLLSPGETWLYEFTTTAIDLLTPPEGTPTVPGCDPGLTAPKPYLHMKNIGYGYCRSV